MTSKATNGSPRDSFTTESIGSRKWRDRTGDVNHMLIREVIEEKSPSLVIATDGSIRGNTTANSLGRGSVVGE